MPTLLLLGLMGLSLTWGSYAHTNLNCSGSMLSGHLRGGPASVRASAYAKRSG